VRIKCYRLSSLVLLVGLAACAPAIYAKNKKPKAPPAVPKDEIEVVGHIALTEPVSRFRATQHYSSFYLYAEHSTGRTVTLIDVTKISQPAVLADVSYPPPTGSDSLALVAGTAVLVTSEPAASPAPAPPQTIRIMDFSDPKNPKVARVFAGVTAMSRDDGRGLIFVADADGIWILHQRLAEDPEAEKAYLNYVMYGSSMYPPSR
jgi:hypothetical protein